MGEPYVKAAGRKKYVELRDKGYTKGDAAVLANEVKAPKKPAAKKTRKK